MYANRNKQETTCNLYLSVLYSTLKKNLWNRYRAVYELQSKQCSKL